MSQQLNNLKRLVVGVMLTVASLSVAASVGHAAGTVTGQLNIMTAQVDEFTLLPGIGPKKAEAIAAAREAKAFTKIEDLQEVKGIGPKLFEKIKDYLKVDGVSDLKVSAATAQATASSPTVPPSAAQ